MVGKQIVQGISTSVAWPLGSETQAAVLRLTHEELQRRIALRGYRLVTGDDAMEQVTYAYSQLVFEGNDARLVACPQEQASLVTILVERLTEEDV